jgi:hypothetical protein
MVNIGLNLQALSGGVGTSKTAGFALFIAEN